MTLSVTPTTSPGLSLRLGDFDTLWQALDYAAKGDCGYNFFSAKGELQRVLSYRELRERARDFGQALVALGLERGDRMIMVADTDPDLAIAFMGCQYAGILPVPVAIPTSLGGKEAYIAQLRHQIEGCGAKAAMAPESLVGFLHQAAEGLSLRLAGTPKDFRDIARKSADLRPFDRSGPSYLQYSSGSTRFPKGIEVSQGSFMANAYAIATDGLRVVPGDRSTSWLPLYHDMGLVGFMLCPLTTQMSVDYIATRDFARRSLTWLQLISQYRGTLSYSPTFGYDLCVRRMRDDAAISLDLSSWRAAGIGGDMVQHETLSRFSNAFAAYGFNPVAFVPSYGMAETTLAMSFAPLDRMYRVDYIDREKLAIDSQAVPAEPGPAARGFVACGRVLQRHEFAIRDAQGQPCQERQVGRIFFRGPSVMTGYFQQPELTAEALSADGWLDTGDLGYLLDGEIVITGRAKDLIIIAGRNIWPQDLEWATEELADLRRGDVAAFSIEDGESEAVVVLVQCRLIDAEARAKLQKDVAALLQKSAGVEARVVLVPPHGLPQTSSGKLSRAKAKANYLQGVYDADLKA
ncbi:MAG TPA: fatty acyl-AMP ligase [Dongiaceae bacterium]|nr:fatty acyl-AMP ligase [Dongiaceae bacterium]